MCIIHGERLFGEYLKRVLLSLPEDAFTETVIEDILRTKPDFSNVIPQNRLTPWTASLMAKTIHVNALEYIPSSMIDEKLLREALSEVNDAIPLFSRRNEKNSAVIPDRLWSKALVKTMVEKIPDNHAVRLLKDLCSIPAAKKNLLDENLFLTLVRKDPDCIKYVPEECLTESLYVAAIAKSPEIIKTVNFKRRTEAMLLAAIGRPSDRMNGLTYITDSQKTPEFLEKALRQNPNIWSSIPEKIRTPEFAEKIALAFMENNAEQLYNFLMDAKKTLPNSFWSRKDILRQLVAIDCYNIFCIPEQFRTPELRIQAAVVGVRQRLSFLRLLTDDIPLSADVMKQIEKGTLARIAELEEQHRTLDNQDLMNIPKRFLTHRVCMGLVTVNEHINFAVLPEKNLDADVYATYVATWNRIDTFNRIPLQEKDFWEKAVKMNPRVAAFAPFSPELFRGAIKEDGKVFEIVFEKIPQKYMREFAELAVQSGNFSPNAIQDAGQEDLLTENNLLKNIRSPFDLNVIPDKFITVPLVLRAIATVSENYERTDVIQTALPKRFRGNMRILRAMAEKDVPIPASWIY
ncbi:MAG: hypothetical protein J6M06_00320, partial [Synergistaceae bacterium]|nr:hypothetical protein [Synergistaceae bacterium]